jgi:multiple sugar transport system substrate-binding protein
MSDAHTEVGRRRFLIGTAAAAGGVAILPAGARRAAAQAKPTISYWNGLTGADGKVMDELIDQFTRETGIAIEQQRIPWTDLYAKLQVSVPAGQGPDLALIHTVEVPHFASDGVLEPIDDATLGGKGFRGEDYLPATWQGGTFQGKRYAVALDVPQHILYLNTKVMKDAGLVGSDGRPRVPASRDDLVAMAKQMSKGDSFGFAIGTVAPGRYTWGFQNLLWQNGANVYTSDLKRSALGRAGGHRGGRLLEQPRRVAQDLPAGECELPGCVHRGQARHVDRGVVELHRAPGREGRVHGGAGAASVQAAGGLDDAPPVHVPEAEERGPRQA